MQGRQRNVQKKRDWTCCFYGVAVAVVVVVGSLSNDDVDGNENGKNTKVLDWQNNNSARASCFFVHSFAVTARQRRENA